jgi:hypothetical protein
MRYDDVDYWDNRYTNDKEPFEFYQTFTGIRHFLTPKYLCANEPLAKQSAQPFPHSNRVLIVGCGNSRLGENMLMSGFKQISNVDFSSVVISQMKSKYNDNWHREMHKRQEMNGEGSPKPKPSNHSRLSKPSPQKQASKKPIENNMNFECLDVTKKLPYNDGSFDLIVCKGTLDAIICNQNASEKVQFMMEECHRVLDDEHGIMMIVSYGNQEDRLDCFDIALWKEVKCYTVPKPFVPGMTEVGA